MCAEAIFSDQSGDAGGQFMRAAEFGQNFMQRRQRQQWESEDRTEAKRARDLFEPVMQAQRQAQIATALSSLETNKQQQQLRTRFAAEAPAFNAKYQEAMKLPTFADQQAALAQLQPQVAWMGLIPEGKGFVDVVNNSRAMAFQSTITDQKIKSDMAEIEARRRAEIEAIRVRGEEERRTNSVRPTSSTGDERLLENLKRARASGNQEDIAFYQAEYDRAVRPPADPYVQAQNYRSQAAALPPGSQQAKDLNALADKLTGQGGGPMTADQFLAVIKQGLGGGVKTTPATPAPTTPVTGTTTTTTIVKDPGFVW